MVTHATDAVDDARTLTIDLDPTGAAVGTAPKVVLNAVGAAYLDPTQRPSTSASTTCSAG